MKLSTEILNQIAELKNTIKVLKNEGKLDDAYAKLHEIKAKQKEYEIQKAIEDNTTETESNPNEAGVKQPKISDAFVNIFKAVVLKKTPNSEELEMYNQMNEKDPTSDLSDGGLTVPKDIRTQIKELRRSYDALEMLVNVESVSTLSGSRVIEMEAEHTPFDNIDEAAEFPEISSPQFRNIEYKIKKKGGILKVTRELLQDTSENILGYLRRWIAKKAKATRNFMILKILSDIYGTPKDIVDIIGIDDIKDILNTKIEPAIALSSKILTNQDGFNWLEKLKDEDGNYILQPNPINATQKLLFGKYPIVVISNKTLKSTIEGTVEDPMGYKYPIYIGDFKEAITIFDRESLSIEFSTEAMDLWGKDLTGVKVRERLDIKAVDNKAVIKGEIKVTV